MENRHPGAMPRQSSLLARRRSLLWRIHFWAALIATPFALIATLTGILYIFTPQIEARLYGHLERVAPAGRMLPLDQAVTAAQAAAPASMQVHSVLPPFRSHDVVRVNLTPDSARTSGHEGHQQKATPASPDQPGFGLPAKSVTVYVNPYSGVVLGTLVQQERFSNWSKRLHSRLLQSDNWRWMIELAASWLMVMLVTGVWLWWPRNGAPLLPKPGIRGRAGWKQWHAFLGVALGLISLVILTTGLTWSKYAGGQVRAARDALGQAPPALPRGLQSHPSEGQPMLQWQAAWEASRLKAPDVAMQLVAPRTEHGVWKASAADQAAPAKRFDLLLDAYSGRQLHFSGWDKQTGFSKATAIGIPFHRGEFGWWNQLLLLAFGMSILFSLVSGWVMYLKRPRRHWIDLPRLLPGAWRSASLPCLIVAIALLVLMPLLALSAACALMIEVAIGMHESKRV